MATSSDADLNKIVMVCEICRVNMVGIIPYQAHIDGKQHKRAEELARNRTLTLTTTTSVPENNYYYCKVCNKSMTGPEPFQQHVESAKHLKAAGMVALTPPKATVTITQAKICKMDYTDAVNDEPDDYYLNKHLKNVTIVEPSESIVDALFKMGYI